MVSECEGGCGVEFLFVLCENCQIVVENKRDKMKTKYYEMVVVVSLLAAGIQAVSADEGKLQ